MKLNSFPSALSSPRSMAFVAGTIGLLLSGAVVAPSAVAAKKAKPATTTTTTATVAPTPTVAVTTALATSTTTTTAVPGKPVRFFFDAPLAGPGANPAALRICVDIATCVSATVAGAPREVSGDLIGTLVQANSVATIAGQQFGVGVAIFSGAIAGCGVGSFTVRIVSSAPPFLGLPAVGSSFPGETRWDVIPDSASRGLTPINGTGTVDFVLSGPNKVTTNIIGRLVCSPLQP